MNTKKCKAEGCESTQIKARGLCNTCYQWSKTHGWQDPSGRKRPAPNEYPSQGACRALDCDTEGRLARGWCRACYVWARDHDWSDPTGRVRRNEETVEALLALLQDAAVSDSMTCYLAPGRNSRWSVKINGKPIPAARAVWSIAFGDPGDAFVLHTCSGGSGETGCININHLYLGDNSRNMLDRSDAMLCNLENNPRAKLTNGQALEIIERRRNGESCVSLAAEFGLSTTAVSDLVTGKSWKRLPGRDVT